MKPIAAAAFLALSTSLLQAESQTTGTATPAPVAPVKITISTSTTPATPAAPGTKPAPAKPPVKKEEPMGKISGIEIPRPNGTFLGLEVSDGVFKLSFYNKRKKPMPVDVTRATARWPNLHLPRENRTVLNPSGTALIGQKPVIGPFVFNVYLTLLKGDGDDEKAVESYVVPYRG